jgi:hypothetical protein
MVWQTFEAHTPQLMWMDASISGSPSMPSEKRQMPSLQNVTYDIYVRSILSTKLFRHPIVSSVGSRNSTV